MNNNGDKDNAGVDTNYWRSFAEYFKDDSVKEEMKSEFVAGAADDLNLSEMNGFTRRHFLALLGTSAALAGAGCVDYYDQGEIVPYNKKPKNVIPGVANYFASTMVDNGEAYGVLIKSREGRPIKIDGNPEHPISRGKINSRIQASIMGLYDPERLQAPTEGLGGKNKIDWAKADEKLATAIQSAQEQKKTIAIVTHSVLSPSLNEILNDLETKGFKVYSYELASGQVRDQAWAESSGEGAYPLIDWSQPKIILALESDFLGAEGVAVEAIRGFASNRSALFKNKVEQFNKLYCVEGQTSVTGLNADVRVRLSPALQVDFVLNLILKLKDSLAFDPAILELASKASKVEVPENLIRDLIANKGKSLVYAGDKVSKQVHFLVNYLNEVLETKAYQSGSSRKHLRNLQVSSDFASLAVEMQEGKIGVVIHLDSNPVYHLPKDTNYAVGLAKVPLTVSITEFENETSVACGLVLPAHHALESWGDFETRTGLYSLQQPVLNPLYKTRQKEGVLLSLSQGVPYQETAYREYVKAFAQKTIFGKMGVAVSFDIFWKTALQIGFVKLNNAATEKKKISTGFVSEVTPGALPKFTVLLASSQTGDGRLISNGWVQEVPHPVSKVVWDNYAAISLKTASDLGIRKYVTPYDKNYDMLTVEVEGRKLTLPCMMLPGMADDTVVIELGYGRKNAGTIGMGETGNGIGVNAVELMSVKGGLTPWLFVNAKVSKGAGSYALVSTQEHYSLDGEITGEGPVGNALAGFGADKFLANEVAQVVEKRGIVKEGTIENGFHYHRHPVFSINDLHQYPGYKWAMAIDINKCTGCNDCIVSCNAENNIPVVGRTQVNKGREMHWMRIDRYFRGKTESVKASFQPMLCQHCDNAPCENVCPVVATSHSPEGLNDMAYNRCVGTRYCANNCPYKVRRFNYYNFRNNLGRKDHWTGKGYYEGKSVELMNNPEVTVRSRGVMEKCSFCVQRISEAKQKAKEQGRLVRDGDVVTACQSACPANAIVFGNINDANSEIRKWANSDLNYKVLEELNVRPNVNYLAKLRYEETVDKTDHKEASGHH